MENTTNQNPESGEDRNLPTHAAKVRHGTGRGAHYEKIGVAWEDPEKGSLYIRLYGNQLITKGFTLYPIED